MAPNGTGPPGTQGSADLLGFVSGQLSGSMQYLYSSLDDRVRPGQTHHALWDTRITDAYKSTTKKITVQTVPLEASILSSVRLSLLSAIKNLSLSLYLGVQYNNVSSALSVIPFIKRKRTITFSPLKGPQKENTANLPIKQLFYVSSQSRKL